MTEQEVRSTILEAMQYANVKMTGDQDMTSLLLAGTEDIALDQLSMDSLATMELCIALETNTGVSIVPDDLQRIETLNSLVRIVLDKAK